MVCFHRLADVTEKLLKKENRIAVIGPSDVQKSSPLSCIRLRKRARKGLARHKAFATLKVQKGEQEVTRGAKSAHR